MNRWWILLGLATLGLCGLLIGLLLEGEGTTDPGTPAASGAEAIVSSEASHTGRPKVVATRRPEAVAKAVPVPSGDNRDQQTADAPAKEQWTDLEHYKRCVELFRKNELESALACFEDYLRLHPSETRVHTAIGSTLAKLGRTAEAYYHYERFLENNPDDYRATVVQRFLDDYDQHIGGVEPESPPPQPGPADSPIDGPLTKEIIADVLHRYIGAMKGCVFQQQQRDSSVTGTLEVGFTIQNNGQVSEVIILTPEHRGTFVATCLTLIFKIIKFPAFTGDPVTVPRLPLKIGK